MKISRLLIAGLAFASIALANETDDSRRWSQVPAVEFLAFSRLVLQGEGGWDFGQDGWSKEDFYEVIVRMGRIRENYLHHVPDGDEISQEMGNLVRLVQILDRREFGDGDMQFVRQILGENSDFDVSFVDCVRAMNVGLDGIEKLLGIEVDVVTVPP